MFNLVDLYNENNNIQERRAREEKEHNERERKIAINDLKSPTNNVTPIKRYVISYELLTVQFNSIPILVLTLCNVKIN